MIKVTTSWDDGDILDKRLADLLSRYGLTGTFYVAKNCRPKRLSDEDLRRLSKRHEIGAHTLNHPDLRTLNREQQAIEIIGSKKWLEEILDLEIRMFCYPKGFYDDSAVNIVKTGGFHGARTANSGVIARPINPFLIDTTIQVYPFPFRKQNGRQYYWRKLLQPYQQRAPKFRTLGVSTWSMYSWLSLAKATFDLAQQKGETFHLWGHSWEIEKYDMWNELEELCRYLADRQNCIYLANNDSIA